MSDGDIFHTLKEGSIVIDQWREHYKKGQTAISAELSAASTANHVVAIVSSGAERGNAVVSIALVRNIRQVNA